MSGAPCNCLRCRTRNFLAEQQKSGANDGEVAQLQEENPEASAELVKAAYQAVSLMYLVGEIVGTLPPFERLVVIQEATAAMNTGMVHAKRRDTIGAVAGSC